MSDVADFLKGWQIVEPWWPLAGLGWIQLVDAALCWKPASFIEDCLTDVGFPTRFWSVLTPLKVLAAAGLVIGIWARPLALLTCGALVAYFLVAITMHVRARDLGRNLFVNATGMLALCTSTLFFVAVT